MGRSCCSWNVSFYVRSFVQNDRKKNKYTYVGTFINVVIYSDFTITCCCWTINIRTELCLGANVTTSLTEIYLKTF